MAGIPWTVVVVASLAAAFAGCGGDGAEGVSDEAIRIANSPPDPACGPYAPAKRFLPRADGVPETWLVVLRSGPADIIGPMLVARYGGELGATWSVINGFAVSKLPNDGALLMSTDPSVCWVEQDVYVSL